MVIMMITVIHIMTEYKYTVVGMSLGTHAKVD
jgi:hypothetical protein